MKSYSKLQRLASLLCAVSLMISLCIPSVHAVTAHAVTATTVSTVKQGNTAYCYVSIDATESLAALDVGVHFDPAKVKITGAYNSVGCTLYDSAIHDDHVQFSYVLDGKGSASKTQLFYFTYQVLANAELGDTYFDITVGEAYDTALQEVTVSGSRCKFSITETKVNKTCSMYSGGSVSTAVGQEFTLNYSFSTNQIAAGSLVINYDPELFEVVEATQGRFLKDKMVDINTDLKGAVYITFLGTEYNSNYDLISIKFRTIKNTTETSQIVAKVTELCDKELNYISCSGYTTNAQVSFDSSYIGDAPAMSLNGTFSYEDQQITLTVALEKDSHLGAGDFVITFDPELVTYKSCTKGFSPSFFGINDKSAAEGKLKFYIISLADIVEEETVLTVVFDLNQPYSCATADFTLDGTKVTDALTERITLNFVDDSVWLEYQVTFLDEDGSVLQSDMYHYGDSVQAPTDPEKESDVWGSYTFDGWDKPVTDCVGDATYKATYSLEYADYIVVFQNWDGTELSREMYHYGDTVTAPADPVKAEDALYCYTFAGWNSDVTACKGNAVYTAVYTANPHEFSSWNCDVPATCTNSGMEHRSCELCGYSEEQAINPLGHDEEAHEGKAATCAEFGWHPYVTCSRCDYSTYVEIGKLGHTEATVPGKAPTCTEIGLTDGKMCITCQTVTLAQKEIPATGHTEVTVPGKAPTCTETGLTDGKTCSVCGVTTDAQEEIPANGHTEETVPGKAPTCTKTGLTDGKVCSVCGVITVEQKEIAANGHTEATVPGKDPTCTETGLTDGKVCSVCGVTTDAQEEIPANGHTEKVAPGKEPTCTETGLTDGKVCSVCGVVTVEQKEIAANGHTEKIVSGKAPTCTETGLTDSKVCSVCGVVTVEQEEIPANGHTEKIVSGKAATCTETGLTDGKECTTCGAVTIKQETIPASGHSWGNWTENKAPTETENGEEIRECTACNVKDCREIAMLGHICKNHLTLQEAKAPTCVLPGIKAYYLCECGRMYQDAEASIMLNAEDIVDPAKGHAEVTDQAVEATCTATGLTEGKRCTICGVTTVAQQTISAKGHTEVTVPGKAPTCTATGLTDGEKCAVCGVTTVEQKEITANGHTEKVVPGKEPTCTATGLTDGKKCAVCGMTTVAQQTIAAKSHNEATVPGKEPTCTATGLTDGKKCTVCGTTTVAQQTISAKGHTEATVPGKAPTCTATGLTDGKKCTVCGVTTAAQKEIPVNGHTEVANKAVAATCTAAGLTEGKYCSTCGTVTVKQNVVPAKGHTETTVAGKAPTCTETGLTDGKKCTACGTVTVAQKAISAKGHTETTVTGKAATCTETGLTDGKKCTTCGTITVAQKTISAKGHNYAGCVCSVCGAKDGTAHAWGSWAKISAGNYKRTCSACAASETMNLPEDKPVNSTPTTNAANTNLNSTNIELIEKVLTNEEQSQVADGAEVRIYLKVEDISANAPAAHKAEAEAKAGNSEIGMYLDIDLIKKVGTAAETPVIKTCDEITVTITIPESLINRDEAIARTYRIVRVHEAENGKLVTDVINGVFNPNDRSFTFQTDKFSTYALAYEDKAADGLKGDADGSGEVDYLDAMLVLQYHTGIVGDDALDLSVCDVDGSDEVDYLDAMLLLQYHTGVIPEL